MQRKQAKEIAARRFKLYKAGKLWLVAGLSFLFIGTVNGLTAHAATAPWHANDVTTVKAAIQTEGTDPYTIQWGDTLSVISEATGVSVQSLANMNNIANVNLIYAGNKLYITSNVDGSKNVTVQNQQGQTIANYTAPASQVTTPAAPATATEHHEVSMKTPTQSQDVTPSTPDTTSANSTAPSQVTSDTGSVASQAPSQANSVASQGSQSSQVTSVSSQAPSQVTSDASAAPSQTPSDASQASQTSQTSQAPSQAPSDASQAPSQSPSDAGSTTSQAPSQAPSQGSTTPSQAPSNASQAPSQAPSQGSTTPNQAPSDASQAPSQAPSQGSQSSQPASDGSVTSQTPSQAPSQASQTPSQAPSDASQAPSQSTSDASQASQASQTSQAPSQAPSDASQTPSQAPSDASQAPSQAGSSASQAGSASSQAPTTPAYSATVTINYIDEMNQVIQAPTQITVSGNDKLATIDVPAIAGYTTKTTSTVVWIADGATSVDIRYYWTAEPKPSDFKDFPTYISALAIYDYDQNPTQQPLSATNIAADIVKYVNEYRVAEGLKPLTVNPLVTQAVNVRAPEVAANYGMAHTRPDGTPAQSALDEAGYHWQTMGEDLAPTAGNTDKEAALNAIFAWAQDAGHRAVMLAKDCQDVGVALAQGTDGTWYAVFEDATSYEEEGYDQPPIRTYTTNSGATV